MIPNKKAELSQWILTKLGNPVIDTLPISTTQIDDLIDDAIDYYQLFAGDVGNEMNYVVINHINQAPTNICQLSGTPFSFCDQTIAEPFLKNKAEYQLPKSVLAVVNALPGSNGPFGNMNWLTSSPGQDIIERGINAAENMSDMSYGSIPMGGGKINTPINNYTGMFFPGMIYSGGGSYGSRGGARGTGGGVDMVTYELAMEFMEMLNQRYRVNIVCEFHKASKKVRIQPPPKTNGIYVLSVWSRVSPDHLYDDLFVRNYSLALAMIQLGTTMKFFKGQKFVGGVEFDADFYYSEGQRQKEKLEQEIRDNQWGAPITPFYIG